VGPKEWTIDPTQLKRWPEIFGTTDKKVRIDCYWRVALMLSLPS
jgi:hypothetical protein